MADLILFHHAQGLTEGVEAFAEWRGLGIPESAALGLQPTIGFLDEHDRSE